MSACLTASNLSLSRGDFTVLRRAHLHLACGELMYLSGVSGSGKSSLLWALARLLPLQGELYLQGTVHTQIPLTHWRARVALLPQTAVMFAGSVADNLLYPFQHIQAQQHHTQPRVEVMQTLLQQLGMNDVDLAQAAQSLSGGQQARVALARVLLTQPTLILADEPLANVDEQNAQRIHAMLRAFCQQGGSVLFTSHQVYPSDARLHLDGTGQVQHA